MLRWVLPVLCGEQPEVGSRAAEWGPTLTVQMLDIPMAGIWEMK